MCALCCDVSIDTNTRESESVGELRYVLLTQAAKISSWSIEASLGSSQDQEDHDIDSGDGESWNEGIDQLVGGGAVLVGIGIIFGHD